MPNSLSMEESLTEEKKLTSQSKKMAPEVKTDFNEKIVEEARNDLIEEAVSFKSMFIIFVCGFIIILGVLYLLIFC